MMEKIGRAVIGRQTPNKPNHAPRPQGTMQDPEGRLNTAWKKLIPKNKTDGTVSLVMSGFVSTANGTSCSTCSYYSNGRCMKIEGRPKVSPGNCCNFWERR